MKILKINLAALFQSGISAILVFILIDSTVEYLLYKITGVSIVRFLEQKSNTTFGLKFHSVNIVIFILEMYLVMFFYAMIRPLFISIFKPALITTVVFFMIASLFLFQMINLGIYPLKPGMAFIASTALSFPVSVFFGALIYERTNLK